jgi:hypothetical protein
MHCDEVLVHGYDIAMGLGVAFSPPPGKLNRRLTTCDDHARIL